MNQTSQATSAVSEAQRGIRYRVLLVEDDADIRELIRYNLAQEGFIVEEAADGVQALEKVKRRVPDLMVLDLMLPGMPGLAGMPPDARRARNDASADTDRDRQGHRSR